jgi:integrase
MARPRQDNTPSTTPNRQRLSHFAVNNLKPRERPYTVWDIIQRGLAIVVQPSGHAAWKTIYSCHGRPRWIHLADASAIGLAEARKLANEIMYQVAQGKDPAAERRAERGADTFEQLATRYRKHSETKNKSWKQADALVRKNLLPKWGKLLAASIVRADVKALIASIDAPITANQVLASASAIFTWAIKEELAGVKINPCSGVDRNKTKKRTRILSELELPKFWAAFDRVGWIEGAALKMILLTGQRPGEVRHMRAEHIESGWWTLPKEPITKLNWPGTGKSEGGNDDRPDHRVWLPQVAQQIIKHIGSTGTIFAGSRGKVVNGLEEDMREICQALGVEKKVTPHDLRRTHGSTITGLGFGRDAMNRIENHAEGGIATVYDQYGYADENKKIMEAVADRIMMLVDGSPPNVLPFKISA